MAFSISHLSQTRPQGLWGEQKMAAWIFSFLSFSSMSSKSIRQVPVSSCTRGLKIMS